jgi:hypothetical protein
VEEPSLVLEMRMGLVNRGAFLGWLSQYPEEREILLAPLTGLEVLRHAEEAGGTLVYTMDLNCNLQSKTIQQVLGMRKEQCVELAGVVRLGVERELAELLADGWGHESHQTLQVSGDLERLT